MNGGPIKIQHTREDLVKFLKLRRLRLPEGGQAADICPECKGIVEIRGDGTFEPHTRRPPEGPYTGQPECGGGGKPAEAIKAVAQAPRCTCDPSSGVHAPWCPAKTGGVA